MTAPRHDPPSLAQLADLDRAADAAMRRAEASDDPFYRARADVLVQQANALRRRLGEPRIDRATGRELLPPNRFRPYWHLPPDPAVPLMTAPNDDPYGAVRPTRTTDAITPTTEDIQANG